MSNASKFWYIILFIFVIALVFIFPSVVTNIVLGVLLISITIFLLLYILFGFSLIIVCLIDKGPIIYNPYSSYKSNLVYLVLVRYNLIYFLFYTCIIKLNNWLNNLNK